MLTLDTRLVKERDGKNFSIMHVNANYLQNVENIRQHFSTQGMILADYVLDASSHDDAEGFRIDVDQNLILTGTHEGSAHNFAQAMMEGVENLARHTYAFEPGKKIKAHLRYTDYYNLASLVGNGRPAVFENIDKAFGNAVEKVTLLADIKEGRLPASKILEVTKGRSGKGMWDIFIRPDLVRFEYHDGSTYYMFINIKEH